MRRKGREPTMARLERAASLSGESRTALSQPPPSYLPLKKSVAGEG
jgi:hypothetical protein